MVEEGSSSKTIEKNANKINFKVIILIGALSVAIFFYTQYLQNTDIFDPIDGVFMGLILACGMTSILVAKKYRGSAMFTRAYLFLGVGFFAWFVGDVIYYYYGLVLDIYPYPSPGDFFFVVNYGFAIGHLYLNTKYFRKEWSKGLKAIIVIIPILAVLSFSIFAYATWEEYVDGDEYTQDDLTFDLAYGNIFVVGVSLLFAFAVVGIIVFRESALKEVWLLLASGILLWAIADTIFTYLETTEEFTHDHPVNTVWFASFMLIIYALYKHHKAL